MSVQRELRRAKSKRTEFLRFKLNLTICNEREIKRKKNKEKERKKKDIFFERETQRMR